MIIILVTYPSYLGHTLRYTGLYLVKTKLDLTVDFFPMIVVGNMEDSEK